MEKLKRKSNVNEEKKCSVKYLGGVLLAKMMRGGASALRKRSDEINRLNVFPVPDGDTGDNMRMTMESGIAALENTKSESLAEVMHAISQGMLFGARGNSGVILSQFFAGIAKGFEGSDMADAETLAHALELGVQQAYTSVTTPTEGTILTVAREAVEYAVSRITPTSSIRNVFADLVKEMKSSLARTPELLTILKESGVVDSGGAGLLYIMDGLNRVLNGESVDDGDEISSAITNKIRTVQSFDPDRDMIYGYCTELTIAQGKSPKYKESFDTEAERAHLSRLGDSVILHEHDGFIKLHIHTFEPEGVLSYMRQYGEFTDVKIENMNVSHTPSAKTRRARAIIAVAYGEDMTAIFRDAGADEIICINRNVSPSTEDFINAFKSADAEAIILLPNDKNAFLTARQAANMYPSAEVIIVPTRDVGVGYAVLASLEKGDPDTGRIADIASALAERITTATVTQAVRDACINGISINCNDYIAMLDKSIVTAERSRLNCAKRISDIILCDKDCSTMTVFHGATVGREEAEALMGYIQNAYSDLELYFIRCEQIKDYLFVPE